MRSVAAAVLACSLLVAGCGEGRVSTDGTDAGPGARDVGPPPDGSSAGDDCEARARWVYLVDSGRQLVRFQPDDLTLTPIGTLSCMTGLTTTPFSMSVDRNATAWVLHTDGRIHMVSTADASCTSSLYMPNQQGFELFGMGFVADAEGSAEETLFVAGSSSSNLRLGIARLGSIDEVFLSLTPIGDLPGWPELTGTGAGELWGFFPQTTPPTVHQLDKTTGAALRSFDLGMLAGTMPRAWAFAFWGGRWWVFLHTTLDPTSRIYRLDPDGTLTEVVSDTGLSIVGAGVSTCAPVELI